MRWTDPVAADRYILQLPAPVEQQRWTELMAHADIILLQYVLRGRIAE
ncbi:hypothetical protein HQO90_24935 [Rhodococcus fascians]|nr:hypothetical protein [Rhodococcus fascians]MBY4061025.1 hypothetical protein [Rhodococcus fascians]